MLSEENTKQGYEKHKYPETCGVTRELTVGELLDRRIDEAERLLRALNDLKGSLPGNFLNSGASRVLPFLEL